MRVKFWGTRGSIPVSSRGESRQQRMSEALKLANGRQFENDEAIDRFVREELPFSLSHGYGGSSPCVQILDACDNTDSRLICDMGSGLRDFGQSVISNGDLGQSITYHFFLSHLHWDHIMGLPFFTPAYIPGNKLVIHGCHDDIEAALVTQHSDPHFPVQWHELGSTISFEPMRPGESVTIEGTTVTALKQHHHGDSFGYRFERDNKSVVYSTDAEHQLEDVARVEEYIAFIQHADLVIFDAMYSLADMETVKQDWGHSSNMVGVDLCRRASAKHYCMFHHEPIYSDRMIEKVLEETIRYEQITRDEEALIVSSAWDGLELTV